ncbi:DUF2913 family protein [Citrobacter sedlakii]|nr:DUF2913 family protein [Citrobacter sedlakii]EHG7614475.1 DUF2913 family protein [Citrobacter sedlakii]
MALALARQNGDVLSSAQENLFLTRWLATALKQRHFSRNVRVAAETGPPAGRQREAGQQAELPLALLHRRVD